jgi:hydroxyethylthiazole kinase-like uncharacterized protein yjeF
MKILNSQQVKSADEYTIKHLPISSINLMEQAANACVKYIANKFKKPDKVVIVCGKGNNGGDGLAIARLLLLKNYNVEVVVIEYNKQSSNDFKENLVRYKGSITNVVTINNFKIASTKNTLILDAIIGNGLNRPLEGLTKQTIEKINLLEGIKIAIDIPTGLFADKKNETTQVAFKATYTLIACPCESVV